MGDPPRPVARRIDISVVVRRGTPEWPGDTPFSCAWEWEKRAGASVNVSSLTMSPHVGTHADAPLHVEDGWAGSESLALDAFVGPAWVTEVCSGEGVLEFDDLRLPTERSERVERLLLRTDRSIASGRFPEGWPVLSEVCVRALLARGLVLLGVDTPSVDVRESQDLPVHHQLFAGGANVLENLDLRDVSAGEYDLVALPLRVHGLDAAPVRAVLHARGGA